RLDLVNVDRALLSPMAGEVALPVAVEIQSTDATAARHRILPNRGVHGTTLPRDVARESDVDRQQPSHIASDLWSLILWRTVVGTATISARSGYSLGSLGSRGRTSFGSRSVPEPAAPMSIPVAPFDRLSSAVPVVGCRTSMP